MPHEPYLTVIVPIGAMAGRLGNLNSWLSEAIYRDIKIILVHDDKNDETHKELKEVLSLYDSKNIQFISGEFNGPGAARNYGLKRVRTEWFAFWDADDLPVVKEFESMVDQARTAGKKVAQGQFRVSNAITGSVTRFSKYSSGSWDLQIAKNPGIWRFAFETAEFSGVTFPEISMGEDQVFLAKLGIQEKDVYITKNIVYGYVVGSPNQLTASTKVIEDLIVARRSLAALIRELNSSNHRLATAMLMKQQLTLIKRKVGFSNRILAILFLHKLLFKKLPKNLAILWGLLTKKYSLVTPNQIYLQGGLGNQLFQTSALIDFSEGNPSTIVGNIKDGERRPFVFDLLQFSTNQLNVEIRTNTFRKIKVKYLNFSLRISGQFSDNNRKLHKLYLLIVKQLLQIGFNAFDREKKLVIARGVGFDSRLERRDSNTLYVGYFQSERYAKNLRDVLRASLKIIIESNEILKVMEHNTENREILVLHIRLGDYAENPKFGNLSSEYFEGVVGVAISYRSFDDYWIFSNDPGKAQKIIAGVKDLQFRTVSQESFSDAENLAAMSLGTTFILSNSTFGWWGAYLSNAELKYGSVFFPQPWFEQIESPQLLAPKEWFPVTSFDK
jgi:glycosyltransferase involved in cell wall biosynthesis